MKRRLTYDEGLTEADSRRWIDTAEISGPAMWRA